MDLKLQTELFGSAILLSVLLISGLGLHLIRGLFRLRFEGIKYFFTIDVFMLTLAILTANRAISGDESILVGGAGVGHSVLLSQLITVFALAIACERVLRFIVDRELHAVRTLPLLIVMLLFYLVINIITPLLGLYAEFQHNFLYAPLVAVALYATAQRDGYVPIVRIIRNAYFIYLALGLLFLVVRPVMVADLKYHEGLIPGFNVRLYGFATHPNSLAPYSLMLLCALWACPFARPNWNRLAWATGMLSLFLTQSKTTIGLGLVLFTMMAVMSRRDVLIASQGERYRWADMRTIAIAVVGMSALAVAGMVAVWSGVWSFEGSGGSTGELTLTGRTTIWKLSLLSLWENPLFGYGADLWGGAFQQHMRLFVSHAHNQYVHTLGDSGFVGLAALIVYCAVLGVYSWRARKETRWLSVGIAGYIFIRGITEAPLIVDSVFGPDFATHMFLLVLCVGSQTTARLRAEARSPAFAGRSPVDTSGVGATPARA